LAIPLSGVEHVVLADVLDELEAVAGQQRGEFPRVEECLPWLAAFGGVGRDDVSAALASWNEFVDCADGIRSVKVKDAVTDMRARLTRLQGVTGVDELDDRAAALH
jgi:hypothetical protein